MQVGFEALCTAHKITFSRSVFDSILGIMKRIALHRPPPSALLLTHPPDAALVDNLGLLLQTGTAGGGMSSRSPLMSNTIAVAVEMLPVPAVPAGLKKLRLSIGCERSSTATRSSGARAASTGASHLRAHTGWAAAAVGSRHTGWEAAAVVGMDIVGCACSAGARVRMRGARDEMKGT